MTVFVIYSPDGGPRDAADLEFAANMEVPQRQFKARAATGEGEAAFVAKLPEGTTGIKYRDYDKHKVAEEWPQATADACMWVWWRYASDGPPDVTREAAEEFWTLTADGAVDRRKFVEDARPRLRGEAG